MNYEGYPGDEFASLETLKFRQLEANSLFLGYYEEPGEPCAVSCVIFISQLKFICHLVTGNLGT